MPDVLFFDYWTKGIRHFRPIARNLEQFGISSMLLHVGSTRGPGVPAEQYIDNILCRDVSYYGGSLVKAFDHESPDVVLTINMQTEDRILNRICRTHGARSVFLMHGIYPDPEDLEPNSRVTNSAFGFRQRLIRIPKYTRLISDYLRAVSRDGVRELLDVSNYEYFARLAVNPGRTYNVLWAHKDAYADRALAYANVYRKLLIEQMKYPADRVTVVGNYNIDAMFELLRKPDGEREARAYLEEQGVPKGKAAVAYMEGGYVVPTYTPQGWSTQFVINEIRSVTEAVRQTGMHLVVKLHPVTDPAPYLGAFAGHPDVLILPDGDLTRIVYGSIATLGYTSSTLMLPIACDRPLLIVAFEPELQNLGYYVRHRIATRVESKEELARELENIRDGGYISPAGRRQFVEDYFTYTDGRTQDRIVAEILTQLQLARGELGTVAS